MQEGPPAGAATAGQSGSGVGNRKRPRLMVLGPLPLLTVTIEAGGEDPEIHLHPGGQGVWAVRMARCLGADAELVCALGGESGQVLRSLFEPWGIRNRTAAFDTGHNPTYIHDRRTGERAAIACETEPRLSRHELDSLYMAALDAGMRADVSVLTGTRGSSTLSGEFYRRLAHDLHSQGIRIVTDLVGRQLEETLVEGVELVKISQRDLLDRGAGEKEVDERLLEAMAQLHSDGAANVVVSRGHWPVLALLAGQPVEAIGPRLEVVDPHGTGDSQTAAMAVALAEGADAREAIKLGMAAGAVNATRRGLGSGEDGPIRQLARKIAIREWCAAPA